MTRAAGFTSSAHEDAFRRATEPHLRGAAAAAVCGARTRAGAFCLLPPLREGAGRCLRHAGPKAANLHRERLRAEFLSGRIGAEEWHQREARRAANRLRQVWKKDGWASGRTINLGSHEEPFRANVRDRGIDVDALAPAVADWLRWRYRRTQIDRCDTLSWTRAVSADLRVRIAEAGPRPEGASEATALGLDVRPWMVGPGPADTGSKRQRGDLPRAPKVIRGKGHLRPGRPSTKPPGDVEMDELMSLYRAHRAAVEPMIDACRSEGDRVTVLRALRAYVADPNNAAARKLWLELAARLQPH
jgi:hypothetical protein